MFTADDNMGDGIVDLRPLIAAVKLKKDLQGLHEGMNIRKIVATKENSFVKDSGEKWPCCARSMSQTKECGEGPSRARIEMATSSLRYVLRLLSKLYQRTTRQRKYAPTENNFRCRKQKQKKAV